LLVRGYFGKIKKLLTQTIENSIGKNGNPKNKF